MVTRKYIHMLQGVFWFNLHPENSWKCPKNTQMTHCRYWPPYLPTVHCTGWIEDGTQGRGICSDVPLKFCRDCLYPLSKACSLFDSNPPRTIWCLLQFSLCVFRDWLVFVLTQGKPLQSSYNGSDTELTQSRRWKIGNQWENALSFLNSSVFVWH